MILEFHEESSMCKALCYESAYGVQEIGSKLKELQRKGVWSKAGLKERYKERQGGNVRDRRKVGWPGYIIDACETCKETGWDRSDFFQTTFSLSIFYLNEILSNR